MAVYRNGLKIPTLIWEAAAMHRLVKVECIIVRCGNVGVFDPHALWWYFYSRHWSDTMTVAQHRFFCRRCSGAANFRVKRAIMDVTGMGEPNRLLPMPPEIEWKNFLKRYRG
jgi:hypothetical protein